MPEYAQCASSARRRSCPKTQSWPSRKTATGSAIADGDLDDAERLLAESDRDLTIASQLWARAFWINLAMALDGIRGRTASVPARLRQSIEICLELGHIPALLYANKEFGKKSNIMDIAVVLAHYVLYTPVARSTPTTSSDALARTGADLSGADRFGLGSTPSGGAW